MINAGCEVNCCFKNGFILREEHLQTLTSIIKDRYPNETLIYKITKSNSYVFHTTDINEVINEENSNANIINKLDIIVDNNNIINFSLCFEKGEDTRLKLEGIDKDSIFLLYNEIKTYVEKEITIVKTFLKYDVLKGVCYIITLLAMLGCLLFMILTLFQNDISNVNDILASSDIATKLNYLIEQQANNIKLAGESIYFILPILFGVMLFSFIPGILRFFFGKNGILRITDFFLFGKQKNIYEKKIKTKANIVWSVCIGLVVSIVAGFFVYFITN